MNLKELCKIADYKDKDGICFNNDCIEIMKKMDDKIINLTLTDIPYEEVNRNDNGLRNLNKGMADVGTFNLNEFLNEIYRVTNGICIVFCGREQFSEIYRFFSNKKGTTRPIVWEKTNPSPMNGQYIYLSGVEFAVWFKRSGYKTFNAHCKNTVFKHASGRSKLHPTEKNHKLLEELILDNSNERQIIFDPCSGSGSHLYMARKLGRKFIGTELDKEYFDILVDRLKNNIDNK